MAGRFISRCFWRRSVILRARPDVMNLRLREDGLLTGEVLREMLKQGDEQRQRQENEHKTDQM